MKTAKEILIEWVGEDAVGNSLKEYAITEAMREYAIMHVETALKAVVNELELEIDSSGTFQSVNEHSIINAYPLTNIK